MDSFLVFSGKAKCEFDKSKFERAKRGAVFMNYFYRSNRFVDLNEFCTKMGISFEEAKAVWEGSTVSAKQAVNLYRKYPKKDPLFLKHLMETKDYLEACIELSRVENNFFIPDGIGGIKSSTKIKLFSLANAKNRFLLSEDERNLLKSGPYKNGLSSLVIGRIRESVFFEIKD